MQTKLSPPAFESIQPTDKQSGRERVKVNTAVCWFLLLSLASVSRFAPAQSVSINTMVVDSSPPDGEHLEKAIGYFTSTGYPSYYLGTDQSGYIYDTVSHSQITVDNDGFHYERAKAFTYPGDSYAGIIASVGGQTIWYQNPANGNGGDPTQPWGKQSILNAWCHDLRIEDIDGDGKQDVLCSATNGQGSTVARVAFQNNYNDWQEVDLFPNAGDGITTLHLNGGASIVGCSDGELNWYENPGGPSARNFAAWVPHYIGDCTAGVSLATLNVGNREIVLQASNESLWPHGFAYFDPGSDPYGSWNEVIIDTSYRDVHEIACDTLNGVPFCSVGEQEQASMACNDQGYNSHANITQCRAGVFVWNGNGFLPNPTFFTDTQGNPVLGTHNQALFQVNGVEYVLGANHHAMGGYDPNLYLWNLQIH